MDKELFNPKTIERLCQKTKPNLKQKKAARIWLYFLEEGSLVDEKSNYIRFANILLSDLLGYNVNKMDFEKDNIEFSFTNSEGKKVLGIEAKGSKQDLFKDQHRSKEWQKTAVLQLWSYMGAQKFEYGIATNYNDFILLDYNKGHTTYYHFDFSTVKNNDKKLSEFISIFSKNSIIDKEFIEKLEKESEVEERNFTKEFYKLFHETRLMLIKEFEENGVSRDEAIHFAQLYLNRLMFVFFAEDTDKLEKRLFEELVISGLKSKMLISDQSKVISDTIVSLFLRLDIGSTTPKKIFGFNGGLFQEKISPRIYFKDLRDSKFFKEVHQNSNLKKELELDGASKPIFEKYQYKLNPLIKNLLILASFDFNTEVNVNILGHIFEQSLTDLEELKAGTTSKRKKEGIFYTPEYITDYICRNTIIPYLSKNGAKTSRDLVLEYEKDIGGLEKKFSEIKILDPACGSGAFLIKAVDILLEIHKEIQLFKQDKGAYTALKKRRKIKKDEGQLMLVKWSEEDEAREIIQNNMFGVDINEESVEITKLSLFLKIAKKNKKLIDLSKNIKCGNSLIDDIEVDPHAFDWKKEFPFKFDIVIGNPPYVRQERFSEIKSYLNKHYSSYNSLADLYVYFIEKGMKLTKIDGSISFIIPNKFLRAKYGKELRNFIKSNISIRKIYNFNDYPIFEDATTYPIIFVFDKKEKERKSFIYSEIDNKINESEPIPQLEKNQYKVLYASLTSTQWSFVNEKVNNVLNKLKKDSISLKEVSNNKIFRGVSTGKNEVFIISEEIKKRLLDENNRNNIRKIVTGKEVKRYSLSFQNYYLLFIPWEYKLDFSEKIKNYLKENKEKLEKRPEVKEGRFNWWCLSRYGSKNSEYLFKPKIIYPRINDQCNFYLDKTGEMSLSDNNFFISSNSMSLLAILNSRLIFFYLKQICSTLQGGYLDFRRPYIETIPIHKNYEASELSKKANLLLKLNKESSEKKNKFFNRIKQNLNVEKITKKLEKFYELDFIEFCKELEKQKITIPLNQQNEWETFFDNNKEELTKLKEEIEQIDKEIDLEVYKLYGITAKEQKIIEESLN